jgi:hypothetical protein
VKNIQVVDGAMNCVYPIYESSEEDFAAIFPNSHDVEFADDLYERLGEDVARAITERLWLAPQDKKRAQGIHGTLFYGMDYKKPYFPTRKEKEAIALPGSRTSPA